MNTQDMHNDDALDEVLNRHAVAPASAALRARILSTAQTLPQKSPPVSELLRQLLRSIGGWGVAGPALAFSMLLGVSFDLATRTTATTATTASTLDSTTIWELAMLSTDTTADQDSLQ